MKRRWLKVALAVYLLGIAPSFMATAGWDVASTIWLVRDQGVQSRRLSRPDWSRYLKGRVLVSILADECAIDLFRDRRARRLDESVILDVQ